ncbi:hypothetical protein KW805_03975 [Candidatus Pacearchaeota archaeon]|nr:hypothetical protein [Candidatus Pacearchaeota archaeon]
MRWNVWMGIIILVFLGISYFIPLTIDSGANYNTTTPLLGILIFHNPFILGLYVLIAVVLIVKGTTSVKSK